MGAQHSNKFLHAGDNKSCERHWCKKIGPSISFLQDLLPTCESPHASRASRQTASRACTVALRKGEIGTPRSNTEHTHATHCYDRLLSTPAASLSQPVPQRAAMLSRCRTPCLHVTILSFDGVVGRQRRAAARQLTARNAPHGVSDRSGRRAAALHPCGCRGRARMLAARLLRPSSCCVLGPWLVSRTSYRAVVVRCGRSAQVLSYEQDRSARGLHVSSPMWA